MTNVSLLFGAPVRFVKPLKPTPPTVPPPAAPMFQVLSAAGPTSVAPAPLTAIVETFEKLRVTGPLTLPDVPFRVQVAPAPITVRRPPPPSYEIGVVIESADASMTSEVPVMAMPVTVSAGRDSAPPPDVIDRVPPDDPMLTEPPAEMVHDSVKVIESGGLDAESVVPLVASVAVTDALTLATP